MIFIAIDPGLTGAIAAIDDDAQLVLCADLPVIRDNKLEWIDSNDLTGLFLECLQGSTGAHHARAQQAMPGQGVSSTFTTGCVLGSILAACQRIHAPLTLVTAAVWKRSMGLDSVRPYRLIKPG